jgi:hypothetical protein
MASKATPCLVTGAAMTDTPKQSTLDMVRQMALARGYHIETNADGTEERVIRPDGTVAIIARKPKAPEQP